MTDQTSTAAPQSQATTPPLPKAHEIVHTHAPDFVITLSYDARFLRRKTLTTDDGTRFLVDLAQTTSVNVGDAFVLTDGRKIGVKPAAEPLLKITGEALTRLAWHIGNRHTPCQIEADHLLIQSDHVMRDMLSKLGAQIDEVMAPFTPEGGAYGHGRTHGHDHSHPQAHDHKHEHAHDHANGHSHDH